MTAVSPVNLLLMFGSFSRRYGFAVGKHYHKMKAPDLCLHKPEMLPPIGRSAGAFYMSRPHRHLVHPPTG